MSDKPGNLEESIKSPAIDLDKLNETFGVDSAREILDSFILHTDRLIEEVLISIETRDKEVCVDLFHQIKGMSAGVFADCMRVLSTELEIACSAESPEWDRIRELRRELRTRFSEVQLQVRQSRDH